MRLAPFIFQFETVELMRRLYSTILVFQKLKCLSAVICAKRNGSGLAAVSKFRQAAVRIWRAHRFFTESELLLLFAWVCADDAQVGVTVADVSLVCVTSTVGACFELVCTL